MKSGDLNFLEPSGSLQACNGTALPLTLRLYIYIYIYIALRVIDLVTEGGGMRGRPKMKWEMEVERWMK
jgi:hypothetical protein